MTIPAIRLHRMALSGHSHRVELLLSLLGLPFTRVDVDLRSGEHKAPGFLAMNAFGQVPVLEDGDLILADSNAILVYLATRYDAERRWLPGDPVIASSVQRWLSVAAGQLAFGPAAARLVRLFGAGYDHARCAAIAAQLFGVVEAHLATRRFIAAEWPTIADLALYTYTAHAPEGDISLQPYPHIRAWIARVEALPGFVPMQRSPRAAEGAT